ncbi:MAG: tetratricopeptide repeat protein [Bacteroidales bacterium]|nr:tetratricopeptide repeat protein [Bacteroidales bacterium]MCB9012979.1 tetratricopeptide repeat protein [Bacteroidales bacterium]
MKTKGMKTLLIAMMAFLIAAQAFPQKGVDDGSQYGKGDDSIACIRNLSLYYEFYKHDNYKDAINSWRAVYRDCPSSRESLYANGVNMYKAFIEAEKDPAKIAAYSDTIMMIYDQRIKYFGGEGNVLGRKGVDLLRYRRDDGNEYVQQGYECLKKSVELEKDNSSPVVLTTFVSASISLYMRGLLSNEQVVMDYLTASEIIDGMLAVRPSPRTTQIKEAIDANIRESKALSCETIVKIFSPKFEENKENPEFLKKVTGFLSDSQCESEKLFADASAALYKIEPSALSAYKLARVYLQRKEYENCVKYYKEAINLTTSNDDKASYLYELAYVLTTNMNQSEAAANYLGDAIKLKPSWGDAYILLGSIYGTSTGIFDDPFVKKTVYWLAVDMFQKAKSVDPSVSDKCNSLISDYSNYFPSVEDVFFHSLQEGQSYTVGGWINKTTTVRGRK